MYSNEHTCTYCYVATLSDVREVNYLSCVEARATIKSICSHLLMRDAEIGRVVARVMTMLV